METWIKWQRAGCPMVEVHGKSIENARAEYAAVLKLPELHYAQWGAKTPEGNIVLGEYVNG